MKIAVVGAGLYGSTFARHIAMHTRHHVQLIEEALEPAGLAYDYKTPDPRDVYIGRYDLTTICHAPAITRKYLRYFTPSIPVWWPTAFYFVGDDNQYVTPVDLPEWTSQLVSVNTGKMILSQLRGCNPEDIQFRTRERWIPKIGWTNLITKVLDHQQINIMYNTRFLAEHIKMFDYVLYTGRLDRLFNGTPDLALPYFFSHSSTQSQDLEKPLTQIWPFTTMYVFDKRNGLQVTKAVNFSNVYESYPKQTWASQFALTTNLQEDQNDSDVYTIPWRPIINFDSKLIYASFRAKAIDHKLDLGGPIATWTQLSAAQTITKAISHAEEVIEKIL